MWTHSHRDAFLTGLGMTIIYAAARALRSWLARRRFKWWEFVNRPLFEEKRQRPESGGRLRVWRRRRSPD